MAGSRSLVTAERDAADPGTQVLDRVAHRLAGATKRFAGAINAGFEHVHLPACRDGV
jgi:hypothetical protein